MRTPGVYSTEGNKHDWENPPVEKVIAYIEQSCREAMQAFVFEPNNSKTWDAVKTAIGNFLTELWKEGGLQGKKQEEAFSIACGLGSTMTSEDVENGILNVVMEVAIVEPAEFLVMTLQLRMAEKKG